MKTTKKSILWLQAILVPLLIIGALIGLQTIISLVYNFQDVNFSDTEIQLLTTGCEFVFLLMTLLAARILHRQDALKRKGSFGAGMGAGAYFFIICLLRFPLLYAMSGRGLEIRPVLYILSYIVFALLIGFSEEFLFRGIVFDICTDLFGNTRRGMYLTIFTSGILFGAVHMTNSIGVTNLKGVFIQAIFASVLGWYLGAIYYRSKSLVAVAFLHALNDYSALFIEGIFVTDSSLTTQIASYDWSTLASCPIFILLTLFLLRKSKTWSMNDDYVPSTDNPYAL